MLCEMTPRDVFIPFISVFALVPVVILSVNLLIKVPCASHWCSCFKFYVTTKKYQFLPHLSDFYYQLRLLLLYSTTTTTVSTLKWIESTQISCMKSFDEKLTKVQNMWGSIGGFNDWG